MSSRDADHRVPPAVLEVLLELDAERPVVPHRSGAPVDLGGLEDEAAPLAERHELVHHVGCGIERSVVMVGRSGAMLVRRVSWVGPSNVRRMRQRAASGAHAPLRRARHPLAAVAAAAQRCPGLALTIQLRSPARGAARPRPRDDLVAVEPAVLDEDLVRVVAGDDHAGDEEAGHVGLERRRVVRGNPGRADRSARRPRASSAVFGAKPVIRYTYRRGDALARRAAPRIVTTSGLDRRHAALPARRDAPLAHPVRDVGQHPRLDLLVERRAEVHERHARSGAPQIERRLGRRVAAADHDDVLVERVVPLAVDVRDVRQLLAGHAEQVRRAEVAGRDDDRTRRRQPRCLASIDVGVHQPAARRSARAASRARTAARRARSDAPRRGSTRARRAASACRSPTTNGRPPSESFSAVEKNVT